MIYNNVKERMKEIEEELRKDYRFYLYQLGEQIKEGRMKVALGLILTLIVSFISFEGGIIIALITLIIAIKMLYNANRFQNIYEREKIKEEGK